MSGPIKTKLPDVEVVTPALTDKAVTIQAGKVKTSLYSAIYNLFKTGYDSVYTTASAVALQISNALSGYATETYATNAANNAESNANLYTDGLVATKQPLFDYSVSEIGGDSVTINGVDGGIAEFTDFIPDSSFVVFAIDSDRIDDSSKIIYSLRYVGTGYPLIVNYTSMDGRCEFTIANIDTAASTDQNIIIEYQIVG